MSKEWYMAIGGKQVGPVAEDQIVSNIKNGSVDPSTLVFATGMSAWTALRDVPELRGHLGSAATPGAAPVSSGQRRAHEIDYVIRGEEMQFVEIALDPGESAIAEAGTMMYMTQAIQMETIFGDGSKPRTGIADALFSAGKRILTGESLFMTVFGHAGSSGRERVAFAAPYPGSIIPLDLAQIGGEIVCQKDSFLCAAKGVALSIAFQKRLGVGLFGGEGFIMQRLQGDGMCFVHAGGAIQELTLGAGETLRVDTGCIVALQPSVNYDIQFVGKIKTAIFGGEGLFFATLTGPGRVWLQSLPLSRLAGRIIKAAPGLGRGGREEGSILGGLGGLLDGDNS